MRGWRARRWHWFHLGRQILWLLPPETAGHVALTYMVVYGEVADWWRRRIKRPVRYALLIILRDLGHHGSLPNAQTAGGAGEPR
jgi:hypothetical protein